MTGRTLGRPAKAGRYEPAFAVASRTLVAASRKPSNGGRNSPVRQKFSGCHWTPRQKRADGSSIASMTPSGAVADTPEAVRDRLDRLVVAAVRLAGVGVAQPFAHQPCEQRVLVDPDFVREVVGLCGGTVQRCSSAPGTSEGMSCTSVPPQATFSTWMPRQIAKIGRLRRRASPTSAISNSSRSGSTSTTVGCGASPYALARRRHRRSAAGRRSRRAPRRPPSRDRQCALRPRHEGQPDGSPRSWGTPSIQ